MLTALVAVWLAQAASPSVGVVPGVQLQDEGTSQGQVTKLNCVGSGVSCAKSGTTGTMTISGGGPGSANVASVTVTFTSTGGYASAVVTGQAWVTASSVIVCSPQHSLVVSGSNNTPEVYAVAQFSVIVSTLVASTGFTLNVYSPNGVSGDFNFSCTGA